jgi:CRP-like cAMP-binding protein
MQFVRGAVLHMVSREQEGKASAESGMGMVIWDMLTGGAPYKEVLRRTLNPVFVIRFLWGMVISLLSQDNGDQTAASTSTCHPSDHTGDPQVADNPSTMKETTMRPNALGKVYQPGEVIFRKGDAGDCMFVIQEGQVEVVGELKGQEVRLGVCESGDLIGEMAIFEHQAHSATVRALSKARVLTVDEKTFLRYVHQDPSLAYQLLKMMSNRIRRLDTEIAHLKLDQRLAENDFQIPLSIRPA